MGQHLFLSQRQGSRVFHQLSRPHGLQACQRSRHGRRRCGCHVSSVRAIPCIHCPQAMRGGCSFVARCRNRLSVLSTSIASLSMGSMQVAAKLTRSSYPQQPSPPNIMPGALTATIIVFYLFLVNQHQFNLYSLPYICIVVNNTSTRLLHAFAASRAHTHPTKRTHAASSSSQQEVYGLAALGNDDAHCRREGVPGAKRKLRGKQLHTLLYESG